MAAIENNEGLNGRPAPDSPPLSRGTYLQKSSIDEAQHLAEGSDSGFTQEVMMRIRGLSTSSTNTAPVRRLD